MPTPERAYAPPRARPNTTYGLSDCHSTPNNAKPTMLCKGTTDAPILVLFPRLSILLADQLVLLFPGERRADLRIDVRRQRLASLHLHHLAGVVGNRDVGVVRDVVGDAPDVERLAEHVGLLVD